VQGEKSRRRREKGNPKLRGRNNLSQQTKKEGGGGREILPLPRKRGRMRLLVIKLLLGKEETRSNLEENRCANWRVVQETQQGGKKSLFALREKKGRKSLGRRRPVSRSRSRRSSPIQLYFVGQEGEKRQSEKSSRERGKENQPSDRRRGKEKRASCYTLTESRKGRLRMGSQFVHVAKIQRKPRGPWAERRGEASLFSFPCVR